MRKFKLFLAMIMAVAAFGFMGPVYAEPSHTSVGLTHSDDLTIRREVTNVSNKVTNTFGYTITQGASQPASSNTPATNPENGVTGFPTTASVAFNAVTPADGTATSTGTVDLSGVTFHKVGNYTWTIAENSSSNATNYPLDSTNTYTVKVSVRYDANQNMVATVVVAKGQTKLSDVEGNDSQILFTSAPSFTNITIAKTVSGNMGNQSEYFKVNVTINGTNGDRYNVFTPSTTGITYGGESVTNPTTIDAGTSTAFYLKHGETITIGKGAAGTGANEIPVGITYTFVEGADGNAANYVTNINNSTTDSKDSGTLTTAATNTNTIANSYNSDTLTGVLLTVMPYIIIVAIAVAGIAYLVVKNRKNKEAQAE